MRSFVEILRRQALLVAVTTLVTVGVALAAASARTSRYEGRAEIVVQAPASKTRATAAANLSRPSQDSSRLVPNEIRVLTSEEVRAVAAKALGFSPTVTARQVGQSDVMEVAATAATPQRARAVARQFAAAYVEFRRAKASDDLLASSREVESALGQLSERIDHAAGPEKSTLEDQYRLFDDVQAQLQVDAASALDQARIVSPTAADASPITPGVTTIGPLAAVVGLVLGVDLALLFNFLDESIRTKGDLELACPGLVVLGTVPQGRDLAALVPGQDRSSPTAEAYRSVRTVLLAARRDPPIRMLQVTSPGPSEGKTTVVANLGMVLAAAGRYVVVVDADLRNPTLNERFGLPNDVGLTSIILGTVPLSIALQRVPDQPRLGVLASGPPAPGQAELLSSSRVAGVLEGVGHYADIVLIDSGPVLGVVDAIVVSRLVDSTVLVSMSGRTKRRDVTRAVEQLLQVKAPLMGVILTGTRNNLDRATTSGRQGLIGPSLDPATP